MRRHIVGNNPENIRPVIRDSGRSGKEEGKDSEKSFEEITHEQEKDYPPSLSYSQALPGENHGSHVLDLLIKLATSILPTRGRFTNRE